MSDIKFTFQREKAVEVILYLVRRVEDPTFFRISKLLYFSDKTSLERYGRFICGDDYFAMENGPVPTNIYDMMKQTDIPFISSDPFNAVGHTVTASRDAETDLLSESDLECLNISLELYGNAPFWILKRDSHDDAYEKTWDERGNKRSARMPVEEIVKLLEDSDELIEHLSTQGAD